MTGSAVIGTSVMFATRDAWSPERVAEFSDAPFSMLESASPLVLWDVGASAAIIAQLAAAQFNALSAGGANRSHGGLIGVNVGGGIAGGVNHSRGALDLSGADAGVAAGVNRTHGAAQEVAMGVLSAYAVLRLRGAIDEAAGAASLDAAAGVALHLALDQALAAGVLLADGTVGTASVLLAALDQVMAPGVLDAAARVALRAALDAAAQDIAAGDGQVRTWPRGTPRVTVVPLDAAPESTILLSPLASLTP